MVNLWACCSTPPHLRGSSSLHGCGLPRWTGRWPEKRPLQPRPRRSRASETPAGSGTATGTNPSAWWSQIPTYTHTNEHDPPHLPITEGLCVCVCMCMCMCVCVCTHHSDEVGTSCISQAVGQNYLERGGCGTPRRNHHILQKEPFRTKWNQSELVKSS